MFFTNLGSLDWRGIRMDEDPGMESLILPTGVKLVVYPSGSIVNSEKLPCTRGYVADTGIPIIVGSQIESTELWKAGQTLVTGFATRTDAEDMVRRLGILDPLTGIEERMDEVTFTPSPTMRRVARLALKWHRAGLSGDGLKPATIERARRVATGGSLTLAEVKEIKPWFARHQSDKQGKDWDNKEKPSPGRVAHAFWFSDGDPKTERHVIQWAEKALRDSQRNDAGIPVQGRVLSEEEYEELSEVDEEDIRAAVEDWKRTAPERFKDILNAES